MFQFMLDLFDDFSRFSIRFDERTDFFMCMNDGRVITSQTPHQSSVTSFLSSPATDTWQFDGEKQLTSSVF